MNSSTLVSLLLLAFTAAASPFSLIAFSLVLATDRGPRNGIAFIAGWVTTITLIGVVESFIDINVDATETNTAGKWTFVVQLVLGVVLLVIWARRRFNPRPEVEDEDVDEKELPAWQRRLNTMGYPGAFFTGGAVQTWPVMIAAGATILRLDLPAAQGLAWMFVFALMTTVGIVILEVLAWRSPASAVERLHRLRSYISDHKGSVINWAALIGGVWLVVRSIIGLT